MKNTERNPNVASDLMTPEPVCASELARTMAERRIHRVVERVVERVVVRVVVTDRVAIPVGIVTSLDLLAAMSAAGRSGR